MPPTELNFGEVVLLTLLVKDSSLNPKDKEKLLAKLDHKLVQLMGKK